MHELEVQVGDGKAKVAVAQVSASEPLGSVVWYSVSDQNIPHDKLEQLLASEGVPQEFWPERTRPSSAYKRAVKDQQGAEYYVDYEQILDAATNTRQKVPDTMVLVRRVTDVSKDAMPVVAAVRFDKANNGVEFSPRQGFDVQRDAGLRSRIELAFDMHSKAFSADDVRRMISESLHHSYAMRVRESGGIVFVPRDNMAPVEAVARAVEKLPGSEMVALPVIDRESERATLLKRYEKATLERLGELMLQVNGIVRSGEEIVPSVYGRFVEELNYLKEQKTEYEELLATTMGRVDVEMTALNSYMVRLADQIRPDERKKANRPFSSAPAGAKQATIAP